ncbi:MAG: 50S ribosomal protein L18Ae [Candidatus Bathyarchaeia archaeon]
MSEVKIFRIKGVLHGSKRTTSFMKELRSTTPEAALERVYAEFGSRHRVKRVHVKVESIEVISPEEAKNTIVKQLSED